MNKYQTYSLEQFVWDESFRRWVLQPDIQQTIAWTSWLAEHPEKKPLVVRARALVLAIQPDTARLSPAEKQAAIQRIMGQLGSTPLPQSAQTNRSLYPQFFQRNWYRIAASLLLVAGLGWWTSTRFANGPSGHEQVLSESTQAMIETVNTTTKPIVVNLADGSRVTLQPKSKISYSTPFTARKRAVYLTGEAFFNVAKDPANPFFVYANVVVTKVLGTSFTIRAIPNEKNISVVVKTGRVAVFSRTDPELPEKMGSNTLNGVVLEPNQQIVYTRNDLKMQSPEVVTGDALAHTFDFDDTPVSDVFDTLEKAYGIKLIYDKTLMSGCPITADLTELSLYEKLNLVCKAVGAKYELIDDGMPSSRIIIDGKGCK